jgi:hypothetical protein
MDDPFRLDMSSISNDKFRPPIVRALGITSGGLDSILSALVLRAQGIDVQWVNFETPFFSSDKARRAAEMTGIPLTVQRITNTYMKMLKAPHCGYGGNMNPCLDCHALMFRLAGDMMGENGFHFLFSGEVVGQRPMSQTKPSLRYVEKNSGYEGYILRPLSAKLLSPTRPENEGLVDRDRLLDISGRGRKDQIRLAEAFGITDYPAPAGGCLLTDIGFSRRLRDLLEHVSNPRERDLELLKFGRHFRFPDGYKVVVGRTQKDNRAILGLVDPRRDVTLRMVDMPSPAVLIPGGGSEDILTAAAGLCAAYTKAKEGVVGKVSAKTPNGTTHLSVIVPSRQEFRALAV